MMINCLHLPFFLSDGSFRAVNGLSINSHGAQRGNFFDPKWFEIKKNCYLLPKSPRICKIGRFFDRIAESG